MSSALDVRSRIYCNLGTVISGNIQESSIIGAGLVNVSGTLLLSGVYRIREGDPVELSYFKSGRISRLGRRLRVISSYANPATRVTEVAIGCYLTYQASSTPPLQVFRSSEDTSTVQLSGVAALLLIKPISAKHVAEKCCAALGLRHDPFPLTNEFYRDTFEISGPYLKALSDLLISENYVGYVDSTETLKLINLNEAGGRGPVLNESNIIDISPINSGDPDADVVYSIVIRKNIKLDASIDADNPNPRPEPIGEVLRRNDVIPDPVLLQELIRAGFYNVYPNRLYQTSGYNTEPSQTRTFRHTDKEGEVTTSFITYNPSGSWTATYNAQGTLLSTEEKKGGVWGETVTTATYSTSKDGETETTTETTVVQVPVEEVAEACGFPPQLVPNTPAGIRSTVTGGLITKEIITVKKVNSPDGSLTTQNRTAAMIFTSAGAANIQSHIESFYDSLEDTYPGLFPGSVVNLALRTVSDGVRISFAEKFNAPPPQFIRDQSAIRAPDGSIRLLSASEARNFLQAQQRAALLAQALDSDLGGSAGTPLPNNSATSTLAAAKNPSAGYTINVLEVPEIVYTQNNPGAIILEFTPPYLSDDRLVKRDSKYSVIPSDAATKARAFANRQNTLRFGKRNGQSVIFPIEYLATRPFSPIYLEFKGIVGQYRTDSTNIVFDNTGILVSTDAIFSGGIGQ
jgi:hypothetical protein